MPSALVIVAHPDDETIWMGGTIIRNKGWDWTILSLCRCDDRDRAPRFAKACKILGAKAIMSDLDDENPEKPLPTSEIKKRIKKLLARKEFDFIFTHGKNGEYGHNRHIEAARAVEEMIASRELKCSELRSFAYKKQRTPFMCVPSARAGVTTRLSRREAAMKRYLIKEVYNFDKGSFELLSSSDVEAFNVVGKLKLAGKK
ncbi:PIG-L family deacetylase [Candidatus Micrarchaeota archaeon]|nr:PIG-L family deacetylase [Candidatus Micrarchaeota archaeon]MBU1939284.1 PIG-L family deacetylase [Candidatus Micrarchaeota archaeon]